MSVAEKWANKAAVMAQEDRLEVAQTYALVAIALLLSDAGSRDLPVKLTGWDGEYPLPTVRPSDA
jgi:hypothetical protein